MFRSTSTLANPNLNINPKSNPNLNRNPKPNLNPNLNLNPSPKPNLNPNPNPKPNPLVMGHALCLLQYLTSVVHQSRFYPWR